MRATVLGLAAEVQRLAVLRQPGVALVVRRVHRGDGFRRDEVLGRPVAVGDVDVVVVALLVLFILVGGEIQELRIGAVGSDEGAAVVCRHFFVGRRLDVAVERLARRPLAAGAPRNHEVDLGFGVAGVVERQAVAGDEGIVLVGLGVAVEVDRLDHTGGVVRRDREEQGRQRDQQSGGRRRKRELVHGGGSLLVRSPSGLQRPGPAEP